MGYICQALMQVFVGLLSKFFDFIGTSVITLLTLDAGEGDSVFSIVFSTMGNVGALIAVFARALIVLNFILQIFKVMSSPDGATETPAQLTVRTAIAYAGVALGPTLIRIIQRFFATFYDALFKLNDSFDFSALSWSDFLDNFATKMLDLDAITALFIQLILLIAIGVKFVMFLLECVERYTVLNVLYYFAPLPIAMVGSKSTTQIFSSWVRMLLSQMFLMCCNVLFLRVFMYSFVNYITISEKLSNQVNGHEAGPMMVWAFLVFAILHVGTRMDSYMATLGLSTAQTGAGMGVAIFGAAAMGAKAVSTGARAVKSVGGKAYGASRWAANKVHNRGYEAAKGSNGAKASTNTVINGMSGNLSKASADKLQGAALGRQMQDMMRKAGVSNDLISKCDIRSASFDKETGVASIKTNDGKTTLSFAPTEGKNGRNFDAGKQAGKAVSLEGENGTTLSAVMTAKGADAGKFLSSNPEMDQKMKDWEAKGDGYSAQRVYDANGNDTGAVNFVHKSSDGKVISAEQYAPSTLAGHNDGMKTQEAKVGEMDYIKTDFTAAAQTGATQMESPPKAGMSPEKQAMALQGGFNKFDEQFGTSVKQESGVAVGQGDYSGCQKWTGADGQTYVTAPAAHFTTKGESSSQAKYQEAKNGSSYVTVPVSEGQTFSDVLKPSATGYSAVATASRPAAAPSYAGSLAEKFQAEPQTAASFINQNASWQGAPAGSQVKVDSVSSVDSGGAYEATIRIPDEKSGMADHTQRIAMVPKDTYNITGGQVSGLSAKMQDGTEMTAVVLDRGQKLSDVATRKMEAGTVGVGQATPVFVPMKETMDAGAMPKVPKTTRIYSTARDKLNTSNATEQNRTDRGRRK